MSEESSRLADELKKEQAFVDRAYEAIEHLRSEYRAEQREIESQGAWGSPQARTERDAKAAHFGDQAARLEQIEDRLVFGRIDMEAGTNHYIGRAGLPGEDGSRLLVDWRAPAARPFYQATAADPSGVLRRRHILTHLRKVKGVEDDVLDAKGAAEEGLTFQGEGALMSALAQAREGRMGDIVATIQAEQDSIIRASGDGVLVVQGGPGTGKTAVALHRAAYLLYTHRERLERSGVLILGPSPVFLRYIEQVLPSLGESGVVSVTMGGLLPGLHTQLMDPADVAKAKGKMAWVPTLAAAVKDLQRLPEETKHFRIDGRQAELTRAMVSSARTRARRTGKPHNVAREGFALELLDEIATQLAGDDADAETIQWWRDNARLDRDVRREINLCWLPWTAQKLLAKLYSDPRRLRRVATGLSAADMDLVYRRADAPLTVADIPLLDELEELLGTNEVLAEASQKTRAANEEAELARVQEAIDSQELGGGLVSAELLASHTRGFHDWVPLAERALVDRSWTYGHIVVDEAQDLSPMAWNSVLRRCPSRSITVVGDLDQARGLTRPKSWANALGPAARGLAGEYLLTISYRTPKTITDTAQEVLAELGHPILFPLTSAREVPDALADTHLPGRGQILPPSKDPLWEAVQAVIEEETALLDQEVGQGEGRIGVLVSTPRGLAWGADNVGETALDQRVSMLTAVGAKGLEFDVSILVEPSEIAQAGPGDLFVAMTRSTRRLHSVRTGNLPTAWEQALQQQNQDPAHSFESRATPL